MVKNQPDNAGDAGDADSIPIREDPLEEDMTIHPSILGWRIPWTEEPGLLQSMSHEESDTTEHTRAHTT